MDPVAGACGAIGPAAVQEHDDRFHRPARVADRDVADAAAVGDEGAVGLGGLVSSETYFGSDLEPLHHVALEEVALAVVLDDPEVAAIAGFEDRRVGEELILERRQTVGLRRHRRRGKLRGRDQGQEQLGRHRAAPQSAPGTAVGTAIVTSAGVSVTAVTALASPSGGLHIFGEPSGASFARSTWKWL